MAWTDCISDEGEPVTPPVGPPPTVGGDLFPNYDAASGFWFFLSSSGNGNLIDVSGGFLGLEVGAPVTYSLIYDANNFVLVE